MKKTALIITLALSAAATYAQKIQLKKGALSKDNVPVGKVEGEATLLKGTDVSIKALDGSPLVTIKDPLITFGSPYHEPIRYYAIEFVPLGKKVSFIPDQKKFFTSEKKLVEYLFENVGSEFLGPNGLDAATVDKFITSRDQSQEIARDTARIGQTIRISRVKIMEPIINRPEGAPVSLKSLGKETVSKMWQETLETFNIVQGDRDRGYVVVGQITKHYKGDPSVPSTSPSSKSVEYTVTRKVVPFVVDGQTVDAIYLAKIKSTVSGPDILTYCTSKYVKISDVYSAESVIASWLVEFGCL